MKPGSTLDHQKHDAPMNIRLDPTATPFNSEHTLKCGQAFRWAKHGDWWYGVVSGKIIKLRQTPNKLQFETFPKKASINFVSRYFRLDDDLSHIYSKIDKDRHIHNAIRNLRGLRILRQEPWECLISYICATYKNIPAIRQMIFHLSKRFGKQMTLDNHDFYTFPTPKDLATASLQELKSCKLGFRAANISRTSQIIDHKKFDLEALENASYERAKRHLLSLPGVGQKVADCVLLFSTGKLEAFPVDVWMKRTMLKSYPDYFGKTFAEKASGITSISPSEYREINSFGRKYFGEYAGYAQEYLFACSRRRWQTAKHR